MVSTLMIVVAIIVLVVMALIAINMLIMLVSAWVFCYAGVILLGFGGSKWSSDIAINYLRTVLSIGIQLFTMTLIIGIGQSFIDQYFSLIKGDVPDLNSLIVLLLASIILLVLTNKLPLLLSGGRRGFFTRDWWIWGGYDYRRCRYCHQRCWSNGNGGISSSQRRSFCIKGSI